MRVALYATTDVAARAGAVLAGTTEVSAVVALESSPHKTSFPGAGSVFDLIVTDAQPDHVLAELGPFPLVTAGPPVDGHNGLPVLGECSVRGLAGALARIRGGARIAVAIPGERVSGSTVGFPPPVGHRAARPAGNLAGLDLWEAPGPGPWAAIRVEGEQVLGLVDDAAFVAGIALAAGVSIIKDLGPGKWQPWDRPEPYVRAALEAGLLLGGL